MWPAAAGIALMSFTESIAAARAFGASDEPRPDPNQELLALGLANVSRRRCWVRCRQVAAPRRPRSTGSRARARRSPRLVTAAAALATLLLLGPVIALMPQAALAAVVVFYSLELIKPAEFMAIRRVRRIEFRWARERLCRRRAARHAPGHPGRGHRLAGVAGPPGLQSARPRARPQARHDCLPRPHDRASRRRNVAGPAHPAARGAAVLRQRRTRRGSNQSARRAANIRASCCSTAVASPTSNTRRFAC